MSIKRNGDGDERKLEYIAAALTQSDPGSESPGSQPRYLGFYYNDRDGDAQLVVLRSTIEEAIVQVLGLRKKEGIEVKLEQGCSERVAKPSTGEPFSCWLSGLDEHEKGIVYANFPTSQVYTAAVYSPRNVSPEEAEKKGSRAVVFYQIDPDRVTRIVVSKGTAENAINLLIKLKGEEGIVVVYEENYDIRTIRANLVHPEHPELGLRYWTFGCNLSPVDPQEKRFINKRWFSYSTGSYRPQ